MRVSNIGSGDAIPPEPQQPAAPIPIELPQEQQYVFAADSPGAFLPVAPSQLTCEICGIIDSHDKFMTPSICNECAENPSQGAMKATRSRALDTARALLRDNMGKIDAVDSRELVAAVMSEFGGMPEFAKTWVQNIKMAAITAPGSYVAIKALESVSKMVLTSERNHDKPKEIVEMADDEIENELSAIVMDAIRAGRISADDLFDTHDPQQTIDGAVLSNDDA